MSDSPTNGRGPVHRPNGLRRILYVQPAEVFGGAERQGVLHIANLPRHGFEVVAVVGPGARILRALDDAGVQDYIFLDHLTHEADSPLDGFGGKVRFWGGASLDWLATQRSLLRIARQRKVDLVFASRSTGWIASSLVARTLRLPFAWRTGSRMTHPAQPAALRLLASVGRPDLFLANCEAVRAQFAPLVAAPSRVLPNGVDTVRFDPSRAAPRFRVELGIPAGVPVIGFPARPAPEKGMELLARVVERTARSVPDVRFLVAGEFGWRTEYQEMFAARGLGGKISFLGHVPDVESFLASCDVVVLTSKSRSIEGSPNALLEAMAMERPIVATRVGGVAEVITDGVEGFLVGEVDGEAFAERLVRLLGDPALRRQMGAAGRARVLAHHREGDVVASLAAMLHELIDLARRTPKNGRSVAP